MTQARILLHLLYPLINIGHPATKLGKDIFLHLFLASFGKAAITGGYLAQRKWPATRQIKRARYGRIAK